MRASIIAVTAAIAMSVAAPVLAGNAARVVLDPAKGHSFDVGEGKAVGYFLAKGGQCELTLVLAPKGGIDEVKGAGTRVRFDVAPGKTGAFETPEGGALKFTCDADGKHMTVQSFNRLAYVTPKA